MSINYYQKKKEKKAKLAQENIVLQDAKYENIAEFLYYILSLFF